MRTLDRPAPEPKPSWLKTRLPAGKAAAEVRRNLREKGLHTVCEEARCPNAGECWSRGTATILLMGDICTRSCRFCHVESGREGADLDAGEPARVAEQAEAAGLRYVVLTSVDRDDLDDCGASHYAETVRRIKERDAEILVEALIPDFQGRSECVEMLVDSGVDVLGHNLETVEAQHHLVRDARATYGRSLSVLDKAKRSRPELVTKSSIMLGLGESRASVLGALGDLRAVGVDIVTLGQYLQPSRKQLPVARYVPPEEFAEFGRIAEEDFGFAYCASGPLVRSSYRAAEAWTLSRQPSGRN